MTSFSSASAEHVAESIAPVRMTPGWNDPPPATPTTLGLDRTSARLLQKQRRPVDPSVLNDLTTRSSSGKASHSHSPQPYHHQHYHHPSNNSSNNHHHSDQHQPLHINGGGGACLQPSNLPPQITTYPQQQTGQMSPNFHVSRSYPQLHSMMGEMTISKIGKHPGSAFTEIPDKSIISPDNGYGYGPAHSHSQNSINNTTQLVPPAHLPLPAPPAPIPTTEHSQHSIGLNFVAGLPAQAQMPSLPAIPLLPSNPGNHSETSLGNNYDPSHQQYNVGNSTQPFDHQLSSHPSHQQPALVNQQQGSNCGYPTMQSVVNPTTHPGPGKVQHFDSGDSQQAMIFLPPNSVYLGQGQRPVTQPDPQNYRPPIKAAGDVSLTGPQLAAFLTKATFKLPQGPTREGIQLRIGQFDEVVRSNQLSDMFLKKLNFVVDAIDRSLYAEAWEFFEQMQPDYQSELGASWAHGVRILIQELRKIAPVPGSRANSAGPRYM